ncbi:MAG TPA: thermonuclease family protein [Acidobacteriota bacterium]|nr:thermonuclease family protein [Acidobacteriota bacterium]HNT16737.1 thermonuclease family protein [Acidobacteriota bacterium]
MPALVLHPSKSLMVGSGGSPVIDMRMKLVGIDTPEPRFPEGLSSQRYDEALLRLPATAPFQNLPGELRKHLESRLEGAGTRQKKWSLPAKHALERIVEDGLRVEGNPSPAPPLPKGEGATVKKKGKRRKLFLAVGRESFDCYGRLLAYVAPYMSREEREQEGHPETFNLRMVREGWAVSCIHGGNMPKIKDLALVVSAVKEARREMRGFWAEREKMLHGYEFRALVRMSRGEKGFRYRVADLRDHLLGRSMHLLPAEEYVGIDEEYRVFY